MSLPNAFGSLALPLRMISVSPLKNIDQFALGPGIVVQHALAGLPDHLVDRRNIAIRARRHRIEYAGTFEQLTFSIPHMPTCTIG
jgi:hypothetical protein